MSVEIAKFESLEWTAPTLPPDLPPDLREQGLAVRRRGLAAGHGGFHASYVVMPPGQVTAVFGAVTRNGPVPLAAVTVIASSFTPPPPPKVVGW